MYELLRIAQHGEFYERVFPVVLEDARIFDPVDRLQYVQFWEKRRDRLGKALQSTDQAHLEGFREEMDLYADIRSLLPRLSAILGDMNMPPASAQVKSGFADLIDLVAAKLGE